MWTQEIATFLDNKPGAMAKFCRLLDEKGIDLRAICVSDAMEFGICRMIVNDLPATQQLLSENHMLSTVSDVLIAGMPDEPGAFSEILDILEELKVNVAYCYACLPKQKDKAYLVLKVENPEEVARQLEGRGIEIVTEETMSEVYG